MIVRVASPSEMGVVGELRVAAYKEQDLLAVNPDYADVLRGLGVDGEGEVLVAVEGEHVVGTAMLEPWGPSSEVARGADEAEMRALAVAPAAQGRGVGRALVRAVLDRAARRGVRRLVLSTRQAMTGAHRLYRAEGFTRDVDRDWSPIPGVTLLAFEKAVSG